MNPVWLGDSYDIVKRFFCGALRDLGYEVFIDPMLTAELGAHEAAFYRLLNIAHVSTFSRRDSASALLVDPDTGVHERASSRHLSLARLARLAENHELVFAFDQSFSRGADAMLRMREKSAVLSKLGCHCMYYNSHARFLFASREKRRLEDLRAHLVAVGLPPTRLFSFDVGGYAN